jgi:predicted transglutaminase-like cysteine proteinase
VFFNQNITYASDLIRYKGDYVQTLAETLRHKLGDCDDIAVAKASALNRLGLQERVVLYYCKKHGAPDAHIVTSVMIDGEEYILDCDPVLLIVTKDDRTDLEFIKAYAPGVIVFDNVWGKKWASVMVRSVNQLG